MGNPYATGTDLGVDSNGALCLQPVFPQNEFYHQLQTRTGNIRNFENFPREPQLELKSIISPEHAENFLSRNANHQLHSDSNNMTQCHNALQSDDKLKDANDDTISLQNIVSNSGNVGTGNNNTNNNNNNSSSSNNNNSSNSSNNNNNNNNNNNSKNDNSPVNQNWEEKTQSTENNNVTCIDTGSNGNTNEDDGSKLPQNSSEEGTNCWAGDAVIKEEKGDGIAVGGLGWSGTGVVDVKVERGESKAFKCHLCRKAFSRRANLRNHERAHWNGKQHACPHCGKLFSHRAHLVIHERTHTGEKPFLCPVCPKHFAQKVHLQNHARTHTGEKPYRCRFCSKAFAQRDHLNNHERIHTGEKPFTCARCSKSFTQRGHLKNHQRTHTGEAPFKCTMCSKAFVQRSHLNNHERTHNNNDITNGAGCGSSNSNSNSSTSSNSACSQQGCRFQVSRDRTHCHPQDESPDSGAVVCHDFSNCSNGGGSGSFSCDGRPTSSVVVKVEAKSFDECDEIDGELQLCSNGNGCHYNNCNCTQIQHLGVPSHNSCNCGCSPLPSCHHSHHTPQISCGHLNHTNINCNPDSFVTTCKKEVFDCPQQDDTKRHETSQSDVRTFTYDICKKVLAQKAGLKKCKNTSTGEVLYSALNLLSGYNH